MKVAFVLFSFMDTLNKKNIRNAFSCLFVVLVLLSFNSIYSSTFNALSPTSYVPTYAKVVAYYNALKDMGWILPEDEVKSSGYDSLGLLVLKKRIPDVTGWITYRFYNSRLYSVDGKIKDLLYLLENDARDELKCLVLKRLGAYRREARNQLHIIQQYTQPEYEESQKVRAQAEAAVNLIQGKSIDGGKRLNIGFVSYEVAPLLEKGGLGDVVGSLPRVLQNVRGHNACVVMPYWSIIDDNIQSDIVDENMTFEMDGQKVEVYSYTMDGVKIYLLKCDYYFDVEGYIDVEGEQVYIQKDDIYRSAADKVLAKKYKGTPMEHNTHKFNAETSIFFSKAALTALCALCTKNGDEAKMDIINTADWQTGLIPALAKTSIGGKYDYFKNTKIVHTIHNLDYKGMFRASPDSQDPEARRLWHMMDLPEEAFWGKGDLMGFEAWSDSCPDKISLMKGGIVYADCVTTVSPSYAEEIKSKQFGKGFEGLFEVINPVGILNGVLEDEWDFISPHLVGKTSVDPDKFDKRLGVVDIKEGKKRCKDELLLRYDMEKGDERIPLICFAGRLDDQKGIHLLLPIIEKMLKEKKAQFIISGLGGGEYKEKIELLVDKYKGDIGFCNFISKGEIKRIFAGADILVMPSTYEPCGLCQLQAMRFGTICVVNSVGGLKNSVFDFKLDPESGNGYLFFLQGYMEALKDTPSLMKEKCIAQVEQTLTTALEDYQKESEWDEKVKKVYNQSGRFGWNESAWSYESLYRYLLVPKLVAASLNDGTEFDYADIFYYSENEIWPDTLPNRGVMVFEDGFRALLDLDSDDKWKDIFSKILHVFSGTKDDEVRCQSIYEAFKYAVAEGNDGEENKAVIVKWYLEDDKPVFEVYFEDILPGRDEKISRGYMILLRDEIIDRNEDVNMRKGFEVNSFVVYEKDTKVGSKMVFRLRDEIEEPDSGISQAV